VGAKPITSTADKSGKRGVALQYLTLLIAVCVVTGCARDVVMLNPRTGETTTCRASAVNPWSQQEACIGDGIAHGWKKLE
jgi:hypothetical protein